MGVSDNGIPVTDTSGMEDLLRQINEKLDVITEPEEVTSVSDNTLPYQLADSFMQVHFSLLLFVIFELGIIAGLIFLNRFKP